MRKVIVILLVLAGALGTVHGSVVNYVADNTTVFKNPERGFTEEMSYKVSLAHPNVVKGSVSENWGSRYNMTLAVVLYNYGKFKDQDLPTEILNAFDEDMAELRTYGLKCVLRFAYSERENDIVDATPDWVERHLEQLESHLAANADVIYTIEAGFIGVWGEWYYTANYGNESQHLNANRRLVIESLFRHAPTDRFILFRYPMTKAEYFGDWVPLSADSAFTGTKRARMGCHNDAFLNTWGDMGTYASNNSGDDPAVRQYIATETLYVPNGGETNIEDSTLAKKRYTRAPDEMSTYHWSFCGSSYATQVTKRWRSSGLFDTLNVHMGYRYNMLDAQFTDSAAPAGKMNVTIRVRNAGYAPIYNERTVYLVLKNGSNTYRLALTADPRRWLPNGYVSAINEQVTIPSDVAEGKYHLYLWLPDKYASVENDPRYAVRIANEGVWDQTTGLNDLGAEVTVSTSAPADPGALPTVETALRRNHATTEVRKVIENGQVYVVRNGEKFDMLGNKH
ncbi:MAG: DUF4832 domain-containing protein [Paludibacteraceae bacterium]|nr:DUF4832 domain-containing protein [Paludibacteraceae bacterium]